MAKDGRESSRLGNRSVATGSIVSEKVTSRESQEEPCAPENIGMGSAATMLCVLAGCKTEVEETAGSECRLPERSRLLNLSC